MVYVKICGVKDSETARKVKEYGGDAVGLVFFEKSPRNVSIEQARRIAHDVSGIDKFGLFVNEKRETVLDIARKVGLDVLQFHGDESPRYCESFQNEYEVIKAFRVRDRESLRAIADYKTLRKIILDAYVKGQQGGTGKRLDLNLVEEAKRYGKQLMIAGGLDFDNVRDAVLTEPWGVDVSSGIESSRGVKDPEKIRRFIDRAKTPSVLLEIVKGMESDIIRLHDRKVIKRIRDGMEVRNSSKLSFYDGLAVRKSSLCPNLIAEVKFTSPSNVKAGNPDFISNIYPEEIVREYIMHGASAISMLTHRDFKGKLSYLRVSDMINLPLLRKDFITDENQIYEARYYGADAILLIARILEVQQMKDFIGISKGLGMGCLVESHSKKELEKAIAAGAEIYGINNRDLDTFDVDIETTLNLIGEVPEDRLIVAESGIMTYDDVRRLSRVDAMLVGTGLLRGAFKEDIGARMDILLGKSL